jgi:UDP-N-acetylglucosamine--N-acetylmuramyl-(pentapeptide) pyrophosphoryl-undecaprenol N-acetylglucosamine transferase
LKIVFAGGGTGGHLYPAIAIADALREMWSANVAFIGTADRLEARIVPKAGYRLQTIAAHPLPRGFSLDLFRALGANAAGLVQSLWLLLELRPDLVIATGGYVSFPLVLAARLLRTVRALQAPIALLEPNAQSGLTHRMLAPLVDEVWGAFAADEPRFADKYVHTGVPVRAVLRSLPPRETALRAFGLDPGRRTLLAIGGSQGARAINDAVIAARTGDCWPAGWQMLLLCGERDYERVRAALPAADAVCAYLDDVAPAYAAADLVLARAGASTLAELAAVGKPAVLVPYPHATQDHQTANAQRYARGGAAVVAADDGLAEAFPALLLEVARPTNLQALLAAAERLRGGDPLATILARVGLLVAEKTSA